MKRGGRLPKTVIDLITKRQTMGLKLQKARQSERSAQIIEKTAKSLRKITKKIGKLHLKHKRKEWSKFVRQGTKLAETDSRRFYPFLGKVLGRGNSKPKSNSVWVTLGDGSKRIETDPEKVIEEHRRYLAEARGGADGKSKPKMGRKRPGTTSSSGANSKAIT